MASLKKNIAYNFVYQLLIMFLPFVTAPYLARIIGASGVGNYSYSYAIASYFVFCAMLGLNNYGNRSIASVQGNYRVLSSTFCGIYGLQLITSIVCILAYLVYALGIAQDRTTALIQLLYVISAAFDISWFFFGIEKFKLTVIRNTVIKLLTVIAIFVFVKEKTDVHKYVFIMAFGIFLSQLSLWPYLRHYIKFEFPKWKLVKKHFVPNLTLFIPVIAVSIYKTMAKVMLGAMNGVTDVGFFENAEKIISVPISLITSLGIVMLPRMTSLINAGDESESMKYIDKSMMFALFVANGSAFGLAAISDIFVNVYYGADFNQSAIIMRFLAPTIILLAWGNVIRTQYLIPRKMDNIYIKSAVIGAAVNIAINILLIPSHAAVGAAIGTLCAETCVCVYQTFCIRKEFEFRKYFLYELIFSLSAFVMWITVVNLNFVSNVYLLLIFKIVLGLALYLGLSIVVFKVFSKVQRNKG